MDNPFSHDQLELLLPALRHVAELVQKYGRLDREELQLLLKGGGLDKEDWAVGKLELWAEVLTGVRSATDMGKRNIAIRSLRLGNVPEAHARSAVEMAATAPAMPPKPEFLTPTPLPNGEGKSAVVTPSPRPTPPAQPPEPLAGQESVNPIDDAVMVYIPAGEFIMGSDKSKDNLASDDELPQRNVYLDGYWIYKHEVTVAQYRKFCQDTGQQMPSAPSWGWQDDHPIVRVTWSDAGAYCKWASVELPTEAQWEKAARSTDGRIWPWGNEWDASKCNNIVTGPKKTTPVGSYPAGASPYGLMDMAGNLWEWCADWYDKKYYASAPDRNPPGPASGTRRVLRGGSWGNVNPFYFRFAVRSVDLPGNFRSAVRDWNYPDGRSSIRGFRCASLRFPR